MRTDNNAHDAEQELIHNNIQMQICTSYGACHPNHKKIYFLSYCQQTVQILGIVRYLKVGLPPHNSGGEFIMYVFKARHLHSGCLQSPVLFLKAFFTSCMYNHVFLLKSRCWNCWLCTSFMKKSLCLTVVWFLPQSRCGFGFGSGLSGSSDGPGHVQTPTSSQPLPAAHICKPLLFPVC